MKPFTEVRCDRCTHRTSLGAVEFFIDPSYLETGRLHYVCACGAAFTMDDFMHAGARLVAGGGSRVWQKKASSSAGTASKSRD